MGGRPLRSRRWHVRSAADNVADRPVTSCCLRTVGGPARSGASVWNRRRRRVTGELTDTRLIFVSCLFTTVLLHICGSKKAFVVRYRRYLARINACTFRVRWYRQRLPVRHSMFTGHHLVHTVDNTHLPLPAHCYSVQKPDRCYRHSTFWKNYGG